VIEIRPEESYHLSDQTDISAKSILDDLANAAAINLDGMLYRFHTQLRHERLSVPDWASHVQSVRKSPGFRIIKESPLSGRSNAKPRGYAGDAVMIDSIYRLDNTLSETDAGQRTYEWELGSAACRAVRARRVHLASVIDAVPSSGRILSVACGHLREAERSSAVQSSTAAEIVGLDQDPESIAYVKALALPNACVVQGSVKQILTKSIDLGSFDLIYSAGLYDYLSAKVARALTERLVSMLLPGGRLYIANFTPDLPDIPYMEAVMDWWLTYRTVADMQQLVPDIPGTRSSISYMSVQNGMNAVVWLSIVRD
jgi:extracellular factor (EF) 3-hydroxypalmitic acid methyl ester biosynthesis protein